MHTDVKNQQKNIKFLDWWIQIARTWIKCFIKLLINEIELLMIIICKAMYTSTKFYLQILAIFTNY